MQNSKRLLFRAAPILLTCLGSLGVAGTTVTAVRATPKALSLIEKKKKELRVEKLSVRETVGEVWQCYIPSALIGMATITSIVGISALSYHSQASLVSAYAMLNESYKRYKNAANIVFGEDADSKIEAEMTKETYITAGGYATYSADMDPYSEKILCYDMLSERYFTSTMAAVLNAQYHINRNLQLSGYATLNEFYDFLGLEKTEHGDEQAWSLEDFLECGIQWLDFENRKTIMDDGLECCLISTYQPTDFAYI